MSDQNTITIRFQPQGDRALINAIQALRKAQAGLEGETKKVKKEFKELGLNSAVATKFLRNMKKEGDTLSRSFATLRSRLLLFSFAMSLGGRQLLMFASSAARLDQMETAFVNLQGGTEGANVALDNLREATNGTMSDFDLFQQANNAMVLGITKNSEEMADMFDKAQRLGRALGVDTVRSVESLITGIGRQSRLMLDNIGIIVRSDEAYESYANSLGKSVKDLTDAEKKQAFLTATLESADKKLKSLGAEQKSYQDSLQTLSASFSNLSDRIGNVLLPLVASLSEIFASLFDLFDEERIFGYTASITGLGLAFIALNTGVLTTIASLRAFKITLITTGVGAIIVGLGEGLAFVADKLGLFSDEQKNVKQSTEQATEAINNQKDALLKSEERLSKFLQKTATQIALNRAKLEGDEKNVFIQEKLFMLAEQGVIMNEDNLDVIIRSLMLQFEQEKQLKKIAKTKKDSGEQELELNKLLIGQVNQISTAFVQAAMAGQHMGRAIENAIKGIIAQLAAARITRGILSLPIFAGLTGLPSLPNFLGGILGFHNGGMVQSYHGGGSAGNVPAVLQEGEFVMRRSAVESIGQENLNRMNQTGTGAINVTFTGNVMSQDFIESEAIPAIKKAVRRGADLGIS